MKKILTLALAVTTIFTLTVSVFAASNPQPEYVRDFFSIKISIKQKLITETHKPIYKMHKRTEIIGCERPGTVETKTKVLKPGEIKMIVTGPEVSYNGDYTTKTFKTPEAVKGAGAEFTYVFKLYAPAKGANPVLLLHEEFNIKADGDSYIFNYGTKTLSPMVTVICGYAKCPGPIN